MRAIITLIIKPRMTDSSADCLHTIRCIQEHCEPHELVELTIDYQGWILDGWLLQFDHLTPLSRFPNLVNVNICGPAESDLDDAAYAQLARWWPRLESLSIVTHIRHSDRRPCTLMALVPFAMHCPDLSQLTLPITAAIVPSVEPSIDLSTMKRRSHFFYRRFFQSCSLWFTRITSPTQTTTTPL
ncbi:hypothetical protein BD626DRAFT_510031 [Schizophyllum amplum]|uniref:F-box domain-containing protein n=1 Tax=Schizophyllum amplum TaxID=97359 RepID=A0A550C264_9AGAR|nr:hypothetical protein BD626DRAFT_510031 [Auriculariopsis ampla]